MILTDIPPPKASCHLSSAHVVAASQATNRDCTVLVPSPSRSRNPASASVLNATTVTATPASRPLTTRPTRARRMCRTRITMAGSSMSNAVREPVNHRTPSAPAAAPATTTPPPPTAIRHAA
jgi:hypothetical protein